MAHRTNVNQVHKDFPESEETVKVTDPTCGMQITKKEAKHVLFREAESIYFCSRECLEKYRVSMHAPKAA